MIAELTPTQERARAIEATTRVLDVENECAHGHLPFDSSLTCECWTLERTHALVNQEPLPELFDCEMDNGHGKVGRIIAKITTPDTGEREAHVLDMHRTYIADELSLTEVGRKFGGVTGSRVGQLFKEFGLETKERGWKNTRDKQKAARGITSVGSLSNSTPAPAPAPVERPPAPIPAEVAEMFDETPVQRKARELRELLVAELATVEARALELRDQIATVEALR